jgi:hypothetical protein
VDIEPNLNENGTTEGADDSASLEAKSLVVSEGVWLGGASLLGSQDGSGVTGLIVIVMRLVRSEP